MRLLDVKERHKIYYTIFSSMISRDGGDEGGVEL
jgi:hypothetical protein